MDPTRATNKDTTLDTVDTEPRVVTTSSNRVTVGTTSNRATMPTNSRVSTVPSNRDMAVTVTNRATVSSSRGRTANRGTDNNSRDKPTRVTASKEDKDNRASSSKLWEITASRTTPTTAQ